MAQGKFEPIQGPIQDQEIDAFQLHVSETRTRLAQHMSVLQGFGYTDISTLGKLTIGSQGGQSVPIIQRSCLKFWE